MVVARVDKHLAILDARTVRKEDFGGGLDAWGNVHALDSLEVRIWSDVQRISTAEDVNQLLEKYYAKYPRQPIMFC